MLSGRVITLREKAAVRVQIIDGDMMYIPILWNRMFRPAWAHQRGSREVTASTAGCSARVDEHWRGEGQNRWLDGVDEEGEGA